MKGRKPKPTVLHERHGTFSASRHKSRAREPKPSTPLSVPPAWMSDEQRACWAYVLEHAPGGVLFAIDRDVLAAFVQAQDRFRSAIEAQANFEVLERAAGRDGIVVITPNGAIVQSAYLGIINRAAAAMVKFASELGFTPASRPRLAAATGQSIEPPIGNQMSEFDKFIASNPQRLT